MRQKCCPFFSNIKLKTCDFLITSNDGYGLEQPRCCSKYRIISDEYLNYFLLCTIKPAFFYKKLNKDFCYLALTNRHSGESIFNLNKWPFHVHVCLITDELSVSTFKVLQMQLKHIAWAELTQNH